MLGNCVTCGGKVSGNAAACPHCGEPDPLRSRTRFEARIHNETVKGMGFLNTVAWVVLLLIIAFAFFSCQGS